jgi:CRP-like cAMP-binding protein
MTVVAIGDLYLYELSVDEMFQYMRDNPEIMRDVYTSLATRLRNTNLKVKELIYGTKSDDRDAHHIEEIDQLKREIAEKDKQIQKLQKQIESL